jgi:hypothetical protein
MGKSVYSQKENFMFTVVVLIVCCVTSILFPNIKTVIALLGGLVAVQMSYLLPVVIWVKLSTKPWYSCENFLPIIFFSALVFVGLGSVVITVLSS